MLSAAQQLKNYQALVQQVQHLLNLCSCHTLQLHDETGVFQIFSLCQNKRTKPSRYSISFHAAVPGLPIVGNLLQLKEKKPHQTFTKWAEIYGPIYTIKTGASSVVVLNSTEVAKEVSWKLCVSSFSSVAHIFVSYCDTLFS